MDILLVSNTPSVNSGYVTIDGENTDFMNFIKKEFTPQMALTTKLSG